MLTTHTLLKVRLCVDGQLAHSGSHARPSQPAGLPEIRKRAANLSLYCAA